MENPTPKKPRPRPSVYCNSNLANSSSLPSLTNKRCVKPPSRICDSMSILYHLPEWDMEKRFTKIFTKVRALYVWLIFTDAIPGDQAEIVFTLIGDPPFTFTYQRAEPSPRKGMKAGKVLETHTVSGVSTHEYSIFSALEGTSLSVPLRSVVDLVSKVHGLSPPSLIVIVDTHLPIKQNG